MVCGACEPLLPRPAPDGAAASAAYAYRFPLDRLVRRFKFSGDFALGRWLGTRLAREVECQPRPDLLVPPPLWPGRLRERGFNPALEIARVVSRRLGGVPILVHGAARLRDTGSQPGLRRSERQRNLRGAFRIDRNLCGMRVAIVDDVLTTGATAQALAGALQAAGAQACTTWVVARTPEPGS